jgi:hypothetical protein
VFHGSIVDIFSVREIGAFLTGAHDRNVILPRRVVDAGELALKAINERWQYKGAESGEKKEYTI